MGFFRDLANVASPRSSGLTDPQMRFGELNSNAELREGGACARLAHHRVSRAAIRGRSTSTC